MPSNNLTPYDTGERLEPKLWVRGSDSPTRDSSDTPDRYGKVDFDDDCGDTIATLWLERDEHGYYVLRGNWQQGAVRIAVDYE